ncbi:MAG TPA: hypothetical protein DIC64_03845 [Alphaproteobacteria bacterium]|nr:hypothetical protein [Alphaproteobacteria bacterium]
MKKIEIDVTALIENVKKEHRLFYPVMMYVLLKTLGLSEDEIYYEQSKGVFLKTTFHPDFDIFYKNYVFDCYKAIKEENVPQDKIFFALYEDKAGDADFLLYPFEEKGTKTILTVFVKPDVDEDFEGRCQKEVLSF